MNCSYKCRYWGVAVEDQWGERDDKGLIMMDGGNVGGGGNGLRELIVYVCWGGYLEEGGD